MRSTLVIVACGKAKIWDRNRRAGPTPAKDVYIGAPFRVNKAFAQRASSRWVILSAKYGYIAPRFRIPGPYDATFNDRRTKPISAERLAVQVRAKRLNRYRQVIGLGGAAYRDMIATSFAGCRCRLTFPTSGLPVDKAIQRVKYLTTRSARA